MKLFPQKKSCFANHALVLFAIALAFSVVAGPSAFAGLLSPGNHTITLNHAGSERSALVHVPARAAEKPHVSHAIE